MGTTLSTPLEWLVEVIDLSLAGPPHNEPTQCVFYMLIEAAFLGSLSSLQAWLNSTKTTALHVRTVFFDINNEASGWQINLGRTVALAARSCGLHMIEDAHPVCLPPRLQC